MNINKEDLKKRILANGCFSDEENLEIYEEWFANGPRYLFREVNKKYALTQKSLCDIGCSYGTNLLHCAPGSYGIEIDEQKAKFASSISLTVYQRNAMYDDLSDLPKVEAIWCSAVLEHLDSPHVFLRRLHPLLKPKGLVALYVPIVPIFPFLRNVPGVGKYVSGYEDEDHTYAFTPATLRFVCERAGFRTIEVSTFYPSSLRFLQYIPVVNRIIARCVYIGEKI